MTKVVQLVSTCSECPNRHYYSGSTYWCMKAQPSRLNEDMSIPVWCPLADYPSGVPSPGVPSPGVPVRSAITDRDVTLALQLAFLRDTPESRKDMRRALEGIFIDGVQPSQAPSGLAQQLATAVEAIEADHDPLCMSVLRGKACTCGVQEVRK